MVFKWILIVILSVVPFTSHSAGRLAGPGDTQELLLLHQYGQKIFQLLDIHQTQLAHEGRVFGVPSMNWVFTQDKALNTLWRDLATKPQPFQYIDIVNGLAILQADLANARAVLIVQATATEQYSGSLSVMAMHSTGQAANNSLLNGAFRELTGPETLFNWLTQTGETLMDIEQYAKENVKYSRQWVYLLPMNIRQAHEHIRQHLLTAQWKEQSGFGLALNQWHKANQQISYFLDQIEGKTTLYVVHTIVPKDV